MASMVVLLLGLSSAIADDANRRVMIVNDFLDPEDGIEYQLCDDEARESSPCENRNRICLAATATAMGGEDTLDNADDDIYCGPCELDYVEFGSHSNSNPMCVKIDTISWYGYKDQYKPVYSKEEGKEEDSEERLEFLKETASFIMEHNLGTTIDATTTTTTVNNNDVVDVEAVIQDDDDNFNNSTVDDNLRWSHMEYVLGLTSFSADNTQEDYRSRAGYVYRNVTGTEDDLEPFNATEYYLNEHENNSNSNSNSSFSSRVLQGSLLNGGNSGNESSSATNHLPDRVDWVELGGVTMVKDQGRCGCCWAISLSGAIEGAVFSDPSNDGYLQSMSFQQFISCSKINDGCNGGNLALASLYAEINLFQGITSLNDYPYTDYFGKTTTECLVANNPSEDSDANNKISLAVQVENAQRVAGFDDASNRLTHQQRVQIFKEALAIKPIAMVIKSSCRTLSNYRRGVLTDDGDCACATAACMDHAILMVGYDDTAETPYFKMKNSWGQKWGEDGYFRVAQTPAGLGNYGLFGILAEGVVATGHNTTATVKDEKQTSPIRQWWVILMIVLACILLFCLCFAIFGEHCCTTTGKDYSDEEGYVE